VVFKLLHQLLHTEGYSIANLMKKGENYGERTMTYFTKRGEKSRLKGVREKKDTTLKKD